MLTSPDADTLAALSRLARNTDWEKVEAWLGRCREQAVDRSITAESDVQCRQYQGVVRAIDGLLKITRPLG